MMSNPEIRIPSNWLSVDRRLLIEIGFKQCRSTKFYVYVIVKGRFVHKFVKKTGWFTHEIVLKMALKIKITHKFLKALFVICGQFVGVSWSAWCSAQPIYESFQVKEFFFKRQINSKSQFFTKLGVPIFCMTILQYVPDM